MRQQAQQDERGEQKRRIAIDGAGQEGDALADRAEQRRRGQRAGDHRGAAGDHGDEALPHQVHPHRRHHAGHRRQKPARQPGDRRADAEGGHVDPAGADAERLGHVGVLHRGAGDQPGLGEFQHAPDRHQHQHGKADQHEVVDRHLIGADLHPAERRRDPLHGIAEDHRDAAHHQHRQPPGGQQAVEDAPVEPLDHQPLDDDAEHPHHDGSEDQDGHPLVDAGIGRDDDGIAAQHQELAMGEVDDAHHAEDDRKARGQQHEPGDGPDHLERDNECVVHVGAPPLRLQADFVLGVGLRILDQVAHHLRVFGLRIREGLVDREGAVLAGGDIDVAHRVLGLRVDLHLARRHVVGLARGQHLKQRVALGRAGFLHRIGPDLHALVGDFGNLRHHPFLVRVFLRDLLEEGLVGRVVDRLEIAEGGDDAVRFLMRQDHLLGAAGAVDGGDDRDLALHPGRRPLAIEAEMRGADHRREHEIGLRALDLRDRRAELRDIEREELGRDHLAAVLLDIALHPGRGDVAIVVIGGDGIDLLAVEVHRIGDHPLHRLRGGGAQRDLVAVAHAAFILRVVEVEGVVAVEDRADRLAAGRGDAAHDHVHLVLQRKLGRVLRIERHVRLRVVDHRLDLLAQEPARIVDLLDRKLEHLVHRHAGGIERPREVVQTPDLDRVGARTGHQRRGKRRGRSGARRVEEVASAELGHFESPCWKRMLPIKGIFVELSNIER
ncbi:hypothetical protein SDC9_35799 [bioreactor metagenome]|uniref:NAD-specific glutamate dehydrogenase n=1 Tax=bioreactor metagenome TaxID=1076179 RepID=A0A644VEV3_9ZZZZ